ncbi:FCD domain-containing protein [Colwellia sp. MSW7]|uniref:FCD domain-containing protein n=1 Tax=Colwellia maritima TaxID=2912588 RepID=A0ABS9X576_9GAMM|nr:FCD domain-containing protein [Colwellia maritima]MCI2285393.1 FCD domain-containing protein [Colwellia maritima]
MECVVDAVQILELRMAVEIEMASMAAMQRTTEQMTHITNCFQDMNIKIETGENAIEEDFNFHRAIALASGNTYFFRFIEYIGSQTIIPAREIITSNDKACKRADFLATLQAEHMQILKAIEYQDAELASAAVKSHLKNSIQRHKMITAST